MESGRSTIPILNGAMRFFVNMMFDIAGSPWFIKKRGTSYD